MTITFIKINKNRQGNKFAHIQCKLSRNLHFLSANFTTQSIQVNIK